MPARWLIHPLAHHLATDECHTRAHTPTRGVSWRETPRRAITVSHADNYPIRSGRYRDIYRVIAGLTGFALRDQVEPCSVSKHPDTRLTFPAGQNSSLRKAKDTVFTLSHVAALSRLIIITYVMRCQVVARRPLQRMLTTDRTIVCRRSRDKQSVFRRASGSRRGS